jgi:hypothetical protein
MSAIDAVDGAHSAARRSCRRNYHGDVAYALALCYRSQFKLYIQGSRR